MPTLEVPQESTALQGPAESTIPPPAKCSRGQPTKHPESEGPLPSSEAPQESTVPQEPTEPAEPAFTLEAPLPTLEAPLPTLEAPLPTLGASLPSSEAPQESTVPQEPAEPAEPALTLESLLTAHLRSVSRPHNLLTVRKSGSREGGLWRVWRTIWKRVWRAVWEEWEEASSVF